MNLSKSYEFFNPEKVEYRIHIIGCGSVGSTVAENLVRCGIEKITLWDFDIVESHNIANQMFREEDVGKPKTQALSEILYDINPHIKENLDIKDKGWNGEALSGYVFLCVDNIELRKEIVKKNMYNIQTKAMFDFRTMLTSAQHYAANWSDTIMRNNFYNSMQFTHDEAMSETPTSACGVTLGVVTTVRLISAIGVNNFLNYVINGNLKKFIQVDGFNFIIDSFE